jgi:hypothetical protein
MPCAALTAAPEPIDIEFAFFHIFTRHAITRCAHDTHRITVAPSGAQRETNA